MKISKKGQLWCFWADQCRGQSGGQQLSCLGVATLGATVPPSPQCLLNNILWQKFVFFKCEPRYFPTLGSTQYTAIEWWMLRWENLLMTSLHSEGGRRAAASRSRRANLWHHMGQTGRQWEGDAGINEMRNPIWSTLSLSASPLALQWQDIFNFLANKYGFLQIFCLGRAGFILCIFIDNSSTLMCYSSSLWRALRSSRENKIKLSASHQNGN